MRVKEKPVVVSFGGRDTKAGAYTQYRVFSLRQKKEIEPHRTETSRTGHHWTNLWYLLPGKYFISWEDISNSGKHRCGYGLLTVENDEYRIEKWNGEIPSFAKVCQCIKERLGIIEGEM